MMYGGGNVAHQHEHYGFTPGSIKQSMRQMQFSISNLIEKAHFGGANIHKDIQ